MASKSPLQKYTSYLVYAGLSLAILSAIGSYAWGETRVHKLWFLLLLLMIGTQWLVVAYTTKFAQHKTKTLFRQYQIAKYAKLIIYMIGLVIIVWAIKITQPLAFLTNFIVYYLVFTALETWFFHKWMNTLPPTKEHGI
jgi:hypothetical protein